MWRNCEVPQVLMKGCAAFNTAVDECSVREDRSIINSSVKCFIDYSTNSSSHVHMVGNDVFINL